MVSLRFRDLTARFSKQRSNNSVRRLVPRCRPALDILEDRTLPSTVDWIGGSGNWNDASHWLDAMDMTHHVPTAADDAVIDVLGATVTHGNSGTDPAHDVTIANGTLRLSVGLLDVSGVLSGAGTFALAGGTLSHANVMMGITFVSGVTFDAVTLGADQDLGFGSANVTNGLVLNATLAVGSMGSAIFSFRGTQALTGNGTVVLRGSGELDFGIFSPTSLTIGPNITIRAANGFIRDNIYYSGDMLLNEGTIIVGPEGFGLTISAPTWTNSGTMQVADFGTLTCAGNWMNSGTITANNATLTLGNPLGGDWTNTGTITATNSTVNLGGSFSLTSLNGPGRFTRNDGTVNLTGTLNDVGGTLALNATTGSWNLRGGTINGGTVTESGGAQLLTTNAGGALSGVTLANDFNIEETDFGNALTVMNGLTIQGTIRLGNASGTDFGDLYFQGTQTLSGVGSILMGGSRYNGLVLSDPGTRNLTIGSGITIHGNNGEVYSYIGGALINLGTIRADVAGGNITVGPGSVINEGNLQASNGGSLSVAGLVGNAGNVSVSGAGSALSLAGTSFVVDQNVSVSANQTLTLDGTWSTAATSSVSVSGGTLRLRGTWTNRGSITAAAYAVVAQGNCNGSWTNSGTITSSDSTINLGPDSCSGPWTNSGNISSTNSTVNLGGNFTFAGLGVFNHNGDTINLTGTLDNTGHTLAFNAVTGSWNLHGGTIQGGTITEASGAELVATTFGGTLSGVTLNSDLDVTTATGMVAISNGITLNADIRLGNAGGSVNGQLIMFGPETIAGTGNILFGGSASNGIGWAFPALITFGSEIRIHGMNGYLAVGASGYGLLMNNQGTISSDTAGGHIYVSVSGWSNSGTLRATNGGTLQLSGSFTNSGFISATDSTVTIIGTAATWTNSGTIVLNDSLFDVDPGTSQGTWSNSGTITAADSIVNLGGTFSLASIGTFIRTGGSVNVTGALNNMGSTLALNATTGSWNLAGGVINGGRVSTADGTVLSASLGGLIGVTIDGDLYVSGSAGSVGFSGLTLNGTAYLGDPSGNTSGPLL